MKPLEGLDHIDIPQVWKQGLTGKGISVGHLDTGVDPKHPDLEGRITAWEAFDQCGHALTGHTAVRFRVSRHAYRGHDCRSRGPRCLDRRRAGSQARVGAVLPQGNGTTKQIVRGMEWCVRQGVKVLNLSFGGFGYNQAYEPTVHNLGLLGIFPAFSVGNSGLGVTGSPANHRDACAVGFGQPCRRGPPTSAAAGAFVWGEGEMYVKPDLCAPGVAVHSAIPTAYVQETGAEPYDDLDGTSDGLAARVREPSPCCGRPFPQATAGQIKEALYTTCQEIGPDFHNMHSGRGLIQPLAALRKLEAIVRASRPQKKSSGLSRALNKVESIGLPRQSPGNVAV